MYLRCTSNCDKGYGVSNFNSPVQVVTFTLISILVTDYIQNRRGQALLFSFIYYEVNGKLVKENGP